MSFIEELKRRNVFRVSIANVVVAWNIAQVANYYYATWWVIYQWPWWNEVRSEPRFRTAMQTIAEKVAAQRELIEEMSL